MENDVPQPIIVQPKPRRDPFRVTIVVVATLIVVFSILAFFLATSDYSGELAALSAKQTELSRIAELGSSGDNASPSTKNLATTVKSVADSSTYLLHGSDTNFTVNNSDISNAIDTTVDVTLSSAEANNTFNEDFKDILYDEVNEIINLYESLLAKSSGSDKNLFESILGNYKIIIQAED